MISDNFGRWKAAWVASRSSCMSSMPCMRVLVPAMLALTFSCHSDYPLSCPTLYITIDTWLSLLLIGCSDHMATVDGQCCFIFTALHSLILTVYWYISSHFPLPTCFHTPLEEGTTLALASAYLLAVLYKDPGDCISYISSSIMSNPHIKELNLYNFFSIQTNLLWWKSIFRYSYFTQHYSI